MSLATAETYTPCDSAINLFSEGASQYYEAAITVLVANGIVQDSRANNYLAKRDPVGRAVLGKRIAAALVQTRGGTQ
ncbi:MAG TPA: hypothetical protein VJ836_03065 [Candidatus Saccharimonadales bacterium]|nr:hypothetical protein [Candidatus Saccharimonadales bacterium]